MNPITIETPNSIEFEKALRYQGKLNMERALLNRAFLNEERDSYEPRPTDNSLLNHMIGWICSLFLGQLILIYFLMRMFHK